MSLFEFFLNSIPEIDAFIDKSLNNLKIDLESVEESYTENIESFESHGKKYLVRNIISNSRCLLEHIKKGEVYGFGFFGIRNTPLERCDYLMSTDQSICDQFSQYPDIFAYLSYKREDHHDWGNIVFIKNEDVISHFMSSSRHAETTASKGAIWFGGIFFMQFIN